MSIATHCITLTEQNFQSEVMDANVPVLVDCWASWCGSFYRMNPVVQALAIEFDRQLKVGKLNIAMAERLAKDYNIRAVPTLLLFKNGQVVERIIGGLSQPDLAYKVEALLLGNHSTRSSLAYL